MNESEYTDPTEEQHARARDLISRHFDTGVDDPGLETAVLAIVVATDLEAKFLRSRLAEWMPNIPTQAEINATLDRVSGVAVEPTDVERQRARELARERCPEVTEWQEGPGTWLDWLAYGLAANREAGSPEHDDGPKECESQSEGEAKRSAFVSTGCQGEWDEGWNGGRDWALKKAAGVARERADALVITGFGDRDHAIVTLREIADELDPPAPVQPPDDRTLSVTMAGETYSIYVGESPTAESIAKAITDAVDALTPPE